MTHLGKEICYSWRVWKRKPGFAAAVVLCLGLGIGGVTSVFSVMNGMFVRLMPYESPERLVSFTVTGVFAKPYSNLPAKIYLDWKANNESFAEMAAYRWHQPHVGWKGCEDTQENLRPCEGLAVTPTFFDVLGIRPLRGRVLASDEDSFADQPVVVLGYHVWCDAFGSDTDIIGQEVKLAGRSCTVIGIMGPGYRFLPFGAGTANRKVDHWIPVSARFKHESLSSANYGLIARLKPGISLGQAQADVDRLTRNLLEQHGQGRSSPLRILAQPLPAKLLGPTRSTTWLILTAAVFVLLIACANVVNLFLVQSVERKAEMAVRSALGGSRLRIVRQVIMENMSLVLLGGGLGVLWAHWGVRMLVRIAPPGILGLDQTQMDWRVLGGTLVITFGCGLVIGLVPGIVSSRLNVVNALKECGTRVTSGLRERRITRLVVVSEVVLAFMLVMGASLLIRSYGRLMQVELGIQPRHILTVRLSGPNLVEKHDELLERLQALPSVEGAASSTGLPLSGEPSDARQICPVPAGEQPESYPQAFVRTVSPDYFRVLGALMTHGRYFTTQDNADATGVVIVNEALARRLWPDQHPIDRQIDFGNGTRVCYNGGGETLVRRRVIGVVRDIQYGGPDEDAPLEVFIPFAQRTRWHYILSMALRCRIDPVDLMQAVSHEIHSVDASFKVENINTIAGFHSERTGHRRFLMAMLSVFAAVAFTLAVIGIYGVVAFTVSMRIREMGIRIAFGAQKRDILTLVMKQALGLIMWGISLGLLGAFILRKVIASHLFGISALDPATLLVGVLLVTLVPLAACFLPARRAARIDPMEALRYE